MIFLETLVDFALKEKYEKVKKLRSRLDEMKKLFDWDSFLQLFPIKESARGRSSYEVIFKLKCLFIQSRYGISDEELEYHEVYRIKSVYDTSL